MGIPVLLWIYEGATRARKMRSILRSERGAQSAKAERNDSPRTRKPQSGFRVRTARKWREVQRERGAQPAYEETAKRVPSSHDICIISPVHPFDCEVFYKFHTDEMLEIFYIYVTITYMISK